MTPQERAEKLYAAIAAEVGRGGSAVQIELIAAAIREAVAEERQACAAVVESFEPHGILYAIVSDDGKVGYLKSRIAGAIRKPRR